MSQCCVKRCQVLSQGGKLPGHVPRDNFLGRKHSLQQQFYSRTTSRGGNSLQQNNSLQRANCISPFHHLTINSNVSPKKRFTIIQFHHITIRPYNYFTICAKYIDSPLHRLWNKKIHCTISPQNHIDTFQSFYHITTSSYHDFTISPFHRSATNVNPCGIIEIEVI